MKNLPGLYRLSLIMQAFVTGGGLLALPLVSTDPAFKSALAEAFSSDVHLLTRALLGVILALLLAWLVTLTALALTLLTHLRAPTPRTRALAVLNSALLLPSLPVGPLLGAAQLLLLTRPAVQGALRAPP